MPTPATLDTALGRNLIISITPQIKDGPTFTAAGIGTLTFTGRFQDIDDELILSTENNSPVGSFNGNPQPWEQNGRWQVNEFTYATQLVDQGSTAFPRSNVLRVCSEISFYHFLEVQVWDNEIDPVQVDDFQVWVVMTTPRHRTGNKQRVMDSAIFELIPLIDATTGDFLANPNFGSF